MNRASVRRDAADHNPEVWRLWISPNGVDHLVSRRTSACMTCGRPHPAETNQNGTNP